MDGELDWSRTRQRGSNINNNSSSTKHEERNEMLEHKRKVASSTLFLFHSYNLIRQTLSIIRIVFAKSHRFAFTASRDECANSGLIPCFRLLLLFYYIILFLLLFTFPFDSLSFATTTFFLLYVFLFSLLFLLQNDVSVYIKIKLSEQKISVYFHVYEMPMSNCTALSKKSFMHINFPSTFFFLLSLFSFSIYSL